MCEKKQTSTWVIDVQTVRIKEALYAIVEAMEEGNVSLNRIRYIISSINEERQVD